MRERGTAGGFEFGSDSQARTPWLHSTYMLVYLLALAVVAWPGAVWLLRRLEGPPAWPWAVVLGVVPLLVRLYIYRISPWWALPGPAAVALAHVVWPPSWWVAVVGAVATAVAGFGYFGVKFVLEQREFPWAVLDARSPRPPAPEPEIRFIRTPNRVSGDLVPVGRGPLRLPEPAAGEQSAREEAMNWQDLEYFVKCIDRGESSDIRSWVTDPPRMMPSGRPMTQGMWRRFTKAIEAVGGAVRPYRTAPLELCMRPPAVMYLLREAAGRGQG